jgi:uncharacterized protein YyaL (SSP411 family)
VLITNNSIEETGQKFDMTEAEVNAALQKAFKVLFDARAKRPRPHLDNKMVTAWNGWFVHL